MFRTGKYKKKIVASGWNMPSTITPQLIQKIEKQQDKLEAKKDEEQTKQDRKKLFQAWQRF